MEKIWAVIPTYKRRDLVIECIQAILDQTHRVSHIWVLDNYSQDGTSEIIREKFPQVELVTSTVNLGSSGGFAEGIRAAYEGGASWIWLVDNDAIAQTDALEKLTRARDLLIQQGGVAALGSIAHWTDGKIHPMNRALPNWWVLNRLGSLDKIHCYPVRWTSFVSVLMSRQTVEKYGLPYYDYFTWNDDLEYFGRIGRRELIVFVKNSIVVHKTKTKYTPGKSVGERFFYDVRNRLWVLRGNAFNPVEKMWLIGNFLGHIAEYLLNNGSAGWPIVWRGLKAGIGTFPKR